MIYPSNTATWEIIAKQGYIKISLPLKTVSESNNHDHWTKKHARHKKQKQIVSFALHSTNLTIPPPCSIILTRIAPRQLDYDNLLSSFKWILDSVCDFIIPGLLPGRADSDPRLTITYSQQKTLPKQYGIQIEIIQKTQILLT